MNLNLKENKMKLSIHYDCDGVIRDFHTQAYKIFFSKYPQYKKYLLPVNKFRGWGFSDQFVDKPIAKKIDKLMWEEIFENDEMSRVVFGEAPALVSQDEWKKHLDDVFGEFPDAMITISTHQYTPSTREATTEWLNKNGFMDGDKINVLFTGQKDRFGAHFLLDDKVSTIKNFNKPFRSVGVLRINPSSNGWYVRQEKGKLNIPFAKTLNDFYKIISEKAIELL